MVLGRLTGGILCYWRNRVYSSRRPPALDSGNARACQPIVHADLYSPGSEAAEAGLLAGASAVISKSAEEKASALKNRLALAFAKNLALVRA